MPQPSLFLLLKRPGADIETVVPRDLQGVLRTWKEHLQTHPRASGLAFAGYSPPLSDGIEEMLEICEGVLLIAESARWLIPETYTGSCRVARIPASVHYPAMDVYQGTDVWGSSIRDISVLSDMILNKWNAYGTVSQEKYLARLPSIDMRKASQIARIIPAWALDVPIEHLTLSTACLMGLRRMCVRQLSDLWRQSPDQTNRPRGFGEAKRAELAEELLRFLARGPNDYSLLDEKGHAQSLRRCLLAEIEPMLEPSRSILCALLALDRDQVAPKEPAGQFGMTIAGIYKIVESALVKTPRAQRMGQLFRQRLTTLLQHRHTPLYLDELESEDSWFHGLSSRRAAFEIILHYFAEDQFHLWEFGNRFVIARITWPRFMELKEQMAHFKVKTETPSVKDENEDEAEDYGVSSYEMEDARLPEEVLDLRPLLEQP